MKKPSFGLWAILIMAVVLILTSILLFFLPVNVETEDGGVIQLFKRDDSDIIDLEQAEPIPETEPVYIGEDAVDVIDENGQVLLTFQSKQEAELALNEYVKKCSEQIPEGERLREAKIGKNIFIVQAGGTNSQMTYLEALSAMNENPELIPVEITTEIRAISSEPVQEEITETNILAVGDLFYKQLGSGGVTVTPHVRTYKAGTLVSEIQEEPITTFKAYPSLVLSGTYESAKPEGDPGRNEGEMGKDPGDFSIHLPMQMSLYSYFGTRNGVMHYGIDQKAREGHEITAPAEGVVIYIGERGDYGTVIDIDHGNGFVSRIAHCKDVQVELNQRVFQDEVIALLAPMPNGIQKVPHVHYELLIDGIPYNPLYYYKR